MAADVLLDPPAGVIVEPGFDQARIRYPRVLGVGGGGALLTLAATVLLGTAYLSPVLSFFAVIALLEEAGPLAGGIGALVCLALTIGVFWGAPRLHRRMSDRFSALPMELRITDRTVTIVTFNPDEETVVSRDDIQRVEIGDDGAVWLHTSAGVIEVGQRRSIEQLDWTVSLLRLLSRADGAPGGRAAIPEALARLGARTS